MGENLYKLTYIVDGVEVSVSELAAGAIITPIAEPTKEGHIFSGWSGFPDDMKMPAHDVTIVGTFEYDAIDKVIMDQKTSVTYDIMGRRIQQLRNNNLYFEHGKKFIVR